MVLAHKIKNLAILNGFSSDFRYKNFLDNLWNSHKIWSRFSKNRRENCNILAILLETLWKNYQNSWRKFAELLRSERWKGRFLPNDACKSERSREELPSEYLVAKIGVDTAELFSSFLLSRSGGDLLRYLQFLKIDPVSSPRLALPLLRRCRLTR